MKIDRQCIAGKALIRNEKGEILLLQQSSDTEVYGAGDYHLPGGIADFGEKVEDALIREIQEEIGVDSEIIELIDVIQWVASIRGEITQIYGIFYICKVKSYNFIFGETEVQSHAWINKDNIGDYIILEPSLSVIQDKIQ